MIYKKNYLTQVIFQLKFDPILKLEEDSPTEFQEKIKGRFPRLKRARRITVDAGLLNPAIKQGKAETELTTKNVQNCWTFSTDDTSVLFAVMEDELTLECQKYTDVDSMTSFFDFLWSAFQDIYNVKELSRVGLRYINRINLSTGDPLDWNGYISTDVIEATLGISVPANHTLARSMNTIVWQADDHRIRFRFGIHNRDFPNPIAKKEFILDYDCFSIDAVPPTSAKQCLIDYNKFIETAFENSIEGELRKEMGSPDG